MHFAHTHLSMKIYGFYIAVIKVDFSQPLLGGIFTFIHLQVFLNLN